MIQFQFKLTKDVQKYAELANAYGKLASDLARISSQVPTAQPLADPLRQVNRSLIGVGNTAVTPGYLEAVRGSVEFARTVTAQIQVGVVVNGQTAALLRTIRILDNQFDATGKIVGFVMRHLNDPSAP